MEQLAEACRAYVAELPPHVITWQENATGLAILVFACIGFVWCMNKVADFIIYYLSPHRH